MEAIILDAVSEVFVLEVADFLTKEQQVASSGNKVSGILGGIKFLVIFITVQQYIVHPKSRYPDSSQT